MRWLEHTPCGGAKTSVTCSELWGGWGTHHVVVPKPVLPAVNYEVAGAHTMWWSQNQCYLQWTEMAGAHTMWWSQNQFYLQWTEMAGAHTMWWCQNQCYLQWTMRWLGHTPCGGAKTSVTCSELRWLGHTPCGGAKTSVTRSELWDGWGTHHVVVPKPILPAGNYEMAGAHTMWWCQNQCYLQWTMRWLGHTPCGGAKTSVTCSELWGGWGTHHVVGAKTSVTCSELWDGWGTHHVVVPKPVLPAVNWDGWGTHHVVEPKPVLPAVNYEMAGAHTMW